jgi:outer membrane protein assembly factor BamB
MFGALVAALLAGPAAAQTWNQFQGSEAHTGAVQLSVDPYRIAPKWTASVGALNATSVIPGVVYDGTKVYVSVYRGTNPANGYYKYELVGVNATTGVRLWGSPAESYAGGYSAPAVSIADGRVYAQMAGHSGISGGNPTQYPYLIGVNTATGAQSSAVSYQSQWGENNQPTISGGRVFAMAGYYGGMEGYNSATGSRVWLNTAMPQQTDFIPAADANYVYVYMGPASFSPGPEVGTLFAMNRTTGAQEWVIRNNADWTRVSGPMQSVVLASRGAERDAIVVTNPQTGRAIASFDLAPTARILRWQKTYDVTGAIAVDDGRIAVPARNQLLILDQATGDPLWSWTKPAADTQTLGNNALLLDNLAFVSSSNRVYAVHLATREMVWSAQVGGSLSFGDETLFVSNIDGVYAFAVPVPEPVVPLLIAAAGGLGLRWLRRRARPVETS